jgi:DNA-binding transcriptional regulator PaaX
MADSASNHNTLIDELEDLLDRFQEYLAWVQCFAHIINLVVKVSVTLCRQVTFFDFIILVHPFAIQPQDESHLRYN